MTLQEAEQKVRHVLSRERKEFTVRYQIANGQSVTIYSIAPIHLDYFRDKRPRKVRENPDEVEFKSEHYDLLIAISGQLEADIQPLLGARLAESIQDPSAFHAKQGEVLKAGTAAQSSSELPLLAEFLVRSGTKQSFLRGMRGAAISPGLTLMLRQLEDMIAFNFTLFDDSEYATLSRHLGELEQRIAQYDKATLLSSTADRNTVTHLKREVPTAISNLKDVIEQARVALIRYTTMPKPIISLAKVDQMVQQFENQTIGFMSVRGILHKDLQGYGHYFNEQKAKEAVIAAFMRVENRLNEIRDAASDQSVKAASGPPLVHKLFAAGLMELPYASLADGNPKHREAYIENLKLFLASGVGWFRNSFSHEPHNIPDISDSEALELLMVASHMLRMIDLCLAAAVQP